MRTIVRIVFGSHLYGTATPMSDHDFKSVYVPDAHDILLQRVRGSISTKRDKIEGEKNFAGEIDEESFSLQRYLGLLGEGQTVATDVLFAPEWAMTHASSPEWREIIMNRHRLVTRRSAAFVGYCRQQANKYGIKGSRVAAARKALNFLESAFEEAGPTPKLGTLSENIRAIVDETEHMGVVTVPHISGTSADHWEVCGRKMPFSASIKNARDMMASLVRDYGHRALMAESQQGVDWKALSHAVRVANQAVELLSTGYVTFPLQNSPHILAIKKGEIPYQRVAEEIEQGLIDVEAASAISTLRAEPDFEWIDGFVAGVYGDEVRRTL